MDLVTNVLRKSVRIVVERENHPGGGVILWHTVSGGKIDKQITQS